MAKLSHPPLKDDEDFEAPTLKRTVPAELRDAEDAAGAPAHATTKLRKAEIDALLEKERNQSGMRRAVSDEDIDRFARREAVTLPAPADPSAEQEQEQDGALPTGAAKPPRIPAELTDLDSDDER